MKIHCLPPYASDEIAPELLADRPVDFGVAGLPATAVRSVVAVAATSAAVTPASVSALPDAT